MYINKTKQKMKTKVTQEEVKYFDNVRIINKLVIVKPIPVVESNIVLSAVKQKEQFKQCGIVLKSNNETIKKGEVVHWSGYAVLHYIYIDELKTDKTSDTSGLYIAINEDAITFINDNVKTINDEIPKQAKSNNK